MNEETTKRFEILKRSVGEYVKSGDFEKIESAFEFASIAHYGQKRESGEEYIIHPLNVSTTLSDWKMDLSTVIAGLLHDTIEHGAAKREDVLNLFGEDVLFLVEGVTKISEVKLVGQEDEMFIENLRKMFLAMAKDLRVVFIRFAERVDNLQTLKYISPERQRRYAKDSLEIYAPLAERLGMGEVKATIDDLSFPYVYPSEYKKTVKLSAIHYKKAEDHIKRVKNTILKNLAKEKIQAKIDGRKKHLYSLWSKLERPDVQWDFSKVHDIVALRILVENIAQCYIALGIVHAHFKPVPSLGISDFIAQPKPNGYRSIHTKVFGPTGRIVEVQIRTFEMHKEAEYGVAAHWHLSLLKSKGRISSEDVKKGEKNVVNEAKFRWVKQLVEWQKEISDSKKFLEAVKFDALGGRIYVFSPKGDVYDLPSGATPVDFAYAVHTQLGNYIKSVKVDSKIVPLNFKLKSGQIVEIVKSKVSKNPSSDWLEFAVTALAKRTIIKQLRKT
jgi:GTP diphosphokinase / guanosine-3',5'-bis(diphosphate) 3'-diphosphatase